MDSAGGFRGWDFLFENGLLTFHLVNAYPANVLKVQTTTKVEREQWHHLYFTYDGSGKAAGVQIFVDGREQPLKVLFDNLTETTRARVPWELGRRHDTEVLKLARFQDVRLYSPRPATRASGPTPFEDYAAEVAARPAETWTYDQRHVVSRFYLSEVDEPMKDLAARAEALDRKLEALSAGGAVTLVCRERPEPAYADVLTRGVYTAAPNG